MYAYYTMHAPDKKELSDLLSDSEDYSGELVTTISTCVTELFTLFNPNGWLEFGLI